VGAVRTFWYLKAGALATRVSEEVSSTEDTNYLYYIVKMQYGKAKGSVDSVGMLIMLRPHSWGFEVPRLDIFNA
jgi:hypothetical protein